LIYNGLTVLKVGGEKIANHTVAWFADFQGVT